MGLRFDSHSHSHLGSKILFRTHSPVFAPICIPKISVNSGPFRCEKLQNPNEAYEGEGVGYTDPHRGHWLLVSTESSYTIWYLVGVADPWLTL